MEVCGTHTAGIFKSGLRSLLSPRIRLVSGPGCPVCVTPTAYIDKCVAYARAPGHAVVSFGDMLKTPGGALSLERAKGLGGRVEVVYAPFDALDMAAREPDTNFIVAAVGFETTAPAYAMLLDEAITRGLSNVRLLTSLKSAISAIEWVCGNAGDVDGFLCPGHVSVITGSSVYASLAERYGKPFVVAGFEARHLVNAVYELVRAAAHGGARVANRYPEAVAEDGNVRAREAIDRYFERDLAVWRGLGRIRDSGFFLRPEHAVYDAGSRCLTEDAALPDDCRCADVITGRVDPDACPAFGTACTPEHAKGPCMVSSEGACGIWRAERLRI
jgi:hydrogenase expression/formation protein HypD